MSRLELKPTLNEKQYIVVHNKKELIQAFMDSYRLGTATDIILKHNYQGDTVYNLQMPLIILQHSKKALQRAIANLRNTKQKDLFN